MIRTQALRSTLAVLAIIGALGPARAACPDAAAIKAYVADWTARIPAKALPVASMADAACAQGRLVEALTPTLGRVVGYKAGLTAKAVQERFGASGPVSGVLLERMLLADGAIVPARFGARGVWEADLLLVVRDEGINAATSPEEALRHVSALRAFVELPDLALMPAETLDGVQLAAINVAARLGVAGPEVPLRAGSDTLRRLAETKVVATDAAGATLAEGEGAATLGNPLNAVVWLVGDLKASGRALKAGDLISVGSFTPLTPPRPGQIVTVRYPGLEGAPSVTVRFE